MTNAPVLHRGIGRPTTCRSCQTHIVFARSASTGRLMPFEPDQDTGEWVIVNGTAEHVGKAPATPIEGVETAPRWTSHFANCPDAQTWRKR